MANDGEYRNSCTLMILSGQSRSEEVTLELGIIPDRQWNRGDTIPGLDRPYDWSGWKKFLPAELADAGLSDQLAYWINLLNLKKDSLLRLANNGFHISLACGIYAAEENRTASIVVPPALAEDIGKLGIELRLSFSA